jgi:lysophospholipase L1-like esterase
MVHFDCFLYKQTANKSAMPDSLPRIARSSRASPFRPSATAMKTRTLLPLAAPLLAATLLASSALAQTKTPTDSRTAAEPRETKSVGDLSVRDFASKWMMQQDDLAQVGEYREANRAALASADARPRVVLMGDSITYHWTPEHLPAPADLNVLNRGIRGQNTTQMLLRFEDDVIALKPAAVVILGGTNDLRAYEGDPAAAGPDILARMARNVTAMADIAQARGVKVILCAVPPIGTDRVKRTRDAATLVKVNAWLQSFAQSRDLPFVDFYAVLADASSDLPGRLSVDGIHPNPEGYRLMWPRLQAALEHVGLR